MAGFRVRQIDHVELFVPDVYEAARWYERTLGLAILRRHEHWVGDDRSGPLMISSDDGGTMLALFRGEPQGDRPPSGLKRIAFRVGGEDFLRFLERSGAGAVGGAAGPEVTKLDPVDHGEAFSVYFRDPWGTRLEITCYEAEAVRQRLPRPARGA
jgi:catechol 2,3-dioxygenase-like lactoylglutathione lyase family enzyme